MVGADQKNSSELPMCAGGRLQRDRIHAGNFFQAFLQHPHDTHCALRKRFRLIRMGIGNTFQPRHHFVDAGIVFHRAAAQRIHTEVDSVIPSGEASEMADDFDLADFRQQAKIFAGFFAEQRLRIDRWNIQRRQAIGFFAGRGFLEDQPFILTDVAGNLRAVADKREPFAFGESVALVTVTVSVAISFLHPYT